MRRLIITTLLLVTASAASAQMKARMLRWTADPSVPIAGFEYTTDNEVTWLPMLSPSYDNGIWYGIGWLPTSPTEVAVRSVGLDGAVSDASNYRTYPWCGDADFTGDGIVGGPDFGVFRSLYGQSCEQ